jgi:hypothetical protein
MEKCLYFVFLLLIFFVKKCNALSVGSLTAPSLESIITFTSPPLTTNEVVGLAWLKNGFILSDATTSMTFRGLFPVSGAVPLNGGFLTLESNLRLENACTMTTFGSVFGGGYVLDLASSITQISATTNGNLIQDLSLMLSSDLTVSGIITVRGSCLIDGRGHVLTLNNVATLSVDANATLTLRDIVVRNQRGGKIQLNSFAIELYLDRCLLDLDANYQVSRSGIIVRA